MKELHGIWKDQKEFNKLFWPKPEDFKEKSRQTKEFLLHLMSEMDELLRTTEWKPHRKQNVLPNPAQVRNEITDMFKYLLSICQVWDMTPEDLVGDYWRKSMVCRQRYSEEFCIDLEGRIVLVDIDGVLADYGLGYLNWIMEHYPELTDRCIEISSRKLWIDSKNFGIDDQRYQEIKHDFRISGGKVNLPIFEGAKEFLDTLKAQGYKVVLITSRPIDKYPNMYTDTLEWLVKNELKFDHLWWSTDKRETVLAKSIRSNVVFAVDDDLRYVTTYADLGIKSFWIEKFRSTDNWFNGAEGLVTKVRDIREITQRLKI